LYTHAENKDWEQITNRKNIRWNDPAKKFKWEITKKNKKISEETTETIAEKCDKLLLPNRLVKANKNPRTNAQKKSEISDAVIKDWEAVVSKIKSLTGQEVNAGDTKRELANPTKKVGADSFSWHKTGRAIDLARDLKWLIVEAPSGENMFFKLYLPAKSNLKEKSSYKKQFKETDSVNFHKKGYYPGKKLYKTTFIDVTAILEDNGFSRIKAHEGWDKKGAKESKQEWWHYDKRDGLTWYDALNQIYTENEIVDKTKTLVDEYSGGEEKAKTRLKNEGFPEEVIEQIFK
ncbi:hypothetical protein IQ260_30595, partial [Leptolyngbya cf. ectocarpi LEGE 11479]